MSKILLDKEPTFRDNNCCPFFSSGYCILATDIEAMHGYSWEDPNVCYNECKAVPWGKNEADFSKCPYCTVKK